MYFKIYNIFKILKILLKTKKMALFNLEVARWCLKIKEPSLKI